ncbi:unnamed protein product [Caenorhabditis brenneri]
MNDKIVKKVFYLQFHGPVNAEKNEYREYRVRKDRIDLDSISGCPSDDISIGVKNVTDRNNQKIEDLKKQIREIEKSNSQWNSLEKISDKDTQQIVVQVLQSSEENIKQFEIDNFQSNKHWTRVRTSKDKYGLEIALTSMNSVDTDGYKLGRFKPFVDWDENGEEIPKQIPIHSDGKRAVVALPNCLCEKKQLDYETLLEEKMVISTLPKTATPGSDERESTFNDSSQFSNVERKDQLETVAEDGKDNGRHKSNEEKRDDMSNKDDSASQQKIGNDLVQQEVALKKKRRLELEKDTQTPPVVTVFNNEEREAKKKETAMQRIQDLQSMIDGEQRSITYDRQNIKDLMLMNMHRDTYADRPHILPESSGAGKNVDETDGEEEEEDNAHSERSYQTSTLSSTGSESHQTTEQDWKPQSPIKKAATAVNKKKRGKKGKKPGKKQKNGPKVTMEEVEAIRKKKKEEADKAFNLQYQKTQEHLAKVAATDKNKVLRRVAETAIQMEENEDTRVPALIEQFDESLDLFITSTDDSMRLFLRERYFIERTEDIKKTFLGRTLEVKTRLLKSFHNHIKRSQRLFHFFMFLTSIEDEVEDFYEFELITLNYYLRGSFDLMLPTAKSSALEWDFYYFTGDVKEYFSETDQFVNSAMFVRDKMIILEQIAADYGLTEQETILREAYLGIGQFLIEYRIVTDVAAFMQTCRDKSAFPLMEEWFLLSRKLSPSSTPSSRQPSTNSSLAPSSST